MNTHIMLDIETAAVDPRAAILSIGAVRFSDAHPYLHQEFKANITLDSCKKEQMVVQQSTLDWWDKQDKAAKIGLLRPTPMPLRRALLTFVAWLKGVGGEFLIWSKPPNFDITIMESALATCGFDKPWGHRDMRDLRTLELAAWTVGFNESQWRETFLSIPHDALQDAKAQGERAGRILELFNETKKTNRVCKIRRGGEQPNDAA